MEDDYQIAQFCHQLFTRGEYDECLKNLRLLQEKYPSDPKIIHNIGIVQYYASQTMNTDQLRDSLKRTCMMANANLDDIGTFSNTSQAIYFYNKAVLLFYLKQFYHSLNIIEKIFSVVFDIEQKLAVQVCLLLIQLYTSTFHPDEAIKIIHFTDVFLFGNQNTTCTPSNVIGSGRIPDYANMFGESNILSKFSSNYPGILSKTYEAHYKPILIQYKIKAYIQLKNLKQCKKEVKSLSSYGLIASLFAGYFKADTEYIKGNFRKSLKIMTGTLPLINSLREGTVGPSPSDSGDKVPSEPTSDVAQSVQPTDSLVSKYLSCCYYNNLACNHLSLNKPHLSVFYCRKALQENEDLIGEFPEFDISSNDKSWNCGKSVTLFVYDRRYELLHNLGVHLLHARKPLPAFDCLVETIQIYHSNPRLWLRLAECCIAASRGGNEENFSLKRKLQAAVQHIMGLGIHRKTILVPGHLGKSNKIGSENQQSAAMPVATLEFASICLKNAYLLLPPLSTTPPTSADNSSGNTFQFTKNANTKKASALGKGTNPLLLSPDRAGEPCTLTGNAGVQIDASPSNPMDMDEIHVLRCSILAASAYVNLCLGEYVLALEHSENLLQELTQKGGSSIITYLAHHYCAESLILSNRVSEALLHLDSQTLQSNIQWNLRPTLLHQLASSLNLPTSDFQQLSQLDDKSSSQSMIANSTNNPNKAVELAPFNWIPNDVSSARLIMHYNLCVCYTLLGEYEKASHMLRNNIPFKSTNDLPAQFIMLALYLELKQGHLDIARMIILQHFSQVQH